jgi:hypothetical protein
MRRAITLAICAGCAGTDEPVPGCDEQACAAEGKLCDGEACVDPWRYGSPVFSRCEGEPRATAESLADKAAAYDARAIALHTHAQLPWVVDVVVRDGADPELATSADVVAWWSGENDGLFSGLVLAAEAYRYAVTKDPAARDALATLLRGERLRMDITGVPGLFTRQLIPPGVDGLACPTDLAAYVPSPDKRGNKWVRIGDDGCAQIVEANEFRSTTHCGLDRFAGWCFLDNISQDEYSGHLFALGAVARLVDDVELRAQATDMLTQVGHHLAANGMQFVDWDGRPTQWGKVYPGAAGDTPGYLAILGLSFAATAATSTGDPELDQSYRSLAWQDYFTQIDQWLGPDGCQANWNNLSMLTAAFHHLLWNERDPQRRAPILAAFERELANPTATTRGILDQHNAWYDIMWAAQKPLGPGTDGPAYAVVEDAVCQLRQFPRSNHEVARDTAALAGEVCLDRQDNSLAEVPFEIADRCAATFAYWGNPYARTTCGDAPTVIHQPSGFLLPYWMGRYYGFIAADQ